MSFADLFGDKQTLVVYSFMCGPQGERPCPMCTSQMGFTRLPRYWIVVSSADHIQSAVEGGFVQAGHGRRSPVEIFDRHDWIACYAPREQMRAGRAVQAFIAIGEVTDDQAAAVDRGAVGIHHRRRVAWRKRAKPWPIRRMLDRLSVTRDRKSWGLALRRSVFEISCDDFWEIAKAMRVPAP